MIFPISSPPYIHNNNTTGHIMMLVIIAMTPGIAIQYYFFGLGTLVQILIAISVALSTEVIILKARGYPIVKTIKDNSALLTAIILGTSIPALSPWWITTIGTMFAIIIAKQVYGGLGHNPFNPAMVGYVVLLISFPVQMTNWLPFNEIKNRNLTAMETLHIIIYHHTQPRFTPSTLDLDIDGISQATPLDYFKTSLHEGQAVEKVLAQPIYKNYLTHSACWRWVNAGFLIGGIFLLITRTIRWHIPVGFLVSLTFCSSIGWLYAPSYLLPPTLHLFSGATMLGAFFIATDPVTASTTNNGRLIYAVIIGLLTWLIRSYGGYPDGVAFGVLLANICVPLIDHYTQPRVYGHIKRSIF
ncbi:Electron transport complex subunit RsxD [Candidatus Erwinia haradaeae]|uniref:Ion-translocating oxidoreductase complex subunit D n=1 Tax=Candidatus Erwinia haradaeae TaxID=1922217 RepID=A0A451DBZ5_9GAMM|nr:electron transport complex subunit RsxD [Candidatus Erwinia haradaeae]VFP83921.1 Electron transport complex subunit RsxD [Candidatus Erwinia haradaeae]